MFKGKFGLWVVILVVAFIANWLITSIPVWTHTDDLTVMVDVSVDNDLDAVLANKTLSKTNISISSDNPGMIISNSDKPNYEGYTKYDNYLTSPLVAYVCGLYSHSDGFIPVPSTSNCYKIDLYTVLKTLNAGGDWSSLGMHEDVLSGKVKVYIPNEQSAYYDSVVELFYVTFNNGKTPSDSERTILTEQVNKTLSNCNKIADATQTIYDEYKNPTKEHKFIIAPEFLYVRGKDSSMGSGYNSSNRTTNAKQYRPTYFLNTVYITADVYVNNDESIGAIAQNFITTLQSDSTFMSQTGWRVKNYSFDLNDVYYKTH